MIMIPDATEVKEKMNSNTKETYEREIKEIVRRIENAMEERKTEVSLGDMYINDEIRNKFKEKGYSFDKGIHPVTGFRTLEIINLSLSGSN
ncbi:hypothetical protein ACFPU1_04660 [Thalassorhabdus alkalitolerans]|uniref:Uncharacterized protein n=1 Tax=Thalassorhabdus alkalitolerans TaxID=2282697 RepID=A0ABW0YI91_9BACI